MELLEIIVKMYYCLGTTPPDGEMIKDTYTAYTALMERMRKEVTEMEDQENLERTKVMHEATEKVMEAIDEGPKADTQG